MRPCEEPPKVKFACPPTFTHEPAKSSPSSGVTLTTYFSRTSCHVGGPGLRRRWRSATVHGKGTRYRDQPRLFPGALLLIVARPLCQCRSIDVIGARLHPQTWNRYSYVLNNSLKHTDPTGMTVTQYDQMSQAAIEKKRWFHAGETSRATS